MIRFFMQNESFYLQASDSGGNNTVFMQNESFYLHGSDSAGTLICSRYIAKVDFEAFGVCGVLG